jgi:hypothetical protein
MKKYAILAKDRELAADAAEYRARSERRLGELMAAMLNPAPDGERRGAHCDRRSAEEPLRISATPAALNACIVDAVNALRKGGER